MNIFRTFYLLLLLTVITSPALVVYYQEGCARSDNARMVVKEVSAGEQEGLLEVREEIAQNEQYAPLIYLEREGRTKLPFREEIEVEELRKWVRNALGEGAKEIEVEGKEGFWEASKKHREMVVYFGNDAAILEQFKELGREYYDIEFFYTSSTQLKESQGSNLVNFYIPHSPGVVSIKSTSSASSLVQSIKDIISSSRYPRLEKFTTKGAFKRIFMYHQASIVLFSNKENREFRKAAELQESNELAFFYSNCDKSGYGGWLAEFIGVACDTDTVAIIQQTYEETQKYIYQKEKFELQELKKFIQDWKHGDAKRFYKSEIKEDLDTGSLIKKTVRSTFQKDVIDNIQWVSVWFHDGSSKKSEIYHQTLDQFAKIYKSQNIVIYTFDTTKNDIPESMEDFALNEIPSLLLFPPGRKFSPIRHSEGMTFNHIEAFYKENLESLFELVQTDDI